MKNKLSVFKWKGNEIGLYGLIFAIFVVCGIWLYFDLVKERNRIIEDRAQIAIEQSKFMSQWLRTLFLSSDYVLRDVREKVNLRDLEHATPGKIEHVCSWLGEKVITVPGLSGIAIYDSNLIYRAGNERQVIGFRSNQKIPIGRQIDDKVSFQYMSMEESANKRPTILLNRAVFSEGGSVAGGLVAAINLDFAQKWIQSFNIGSNDVLALIDEKGILLARNPAMPTELSGEMEFFQEQFKSYEASGTASVISFSPIDGVNRVYGIRKMEELPIFLVVGYDLNNVLNEWQHRAWQISCGFLALTGVVFLTVRAYIKSFLQGEELLKLATIDSLTGIFNRRRLFEAGSQEVARINCYGGCLSLVILDIDHFKKVNDTWGHSSGDQVLKQTVQTISSCIRDIDIVGRIGGEEFVVVFPKTNKEEAWIVAERVRLAIQDTTEVAIGEGSSIRITVSMGLVAVSAGETFQDALSRADSALYKAKESGRNRIVVN